MEWSPFLHKPKTNELRKSFLNHVFEIHQTILANFQDLSSTPKVSESEEQKTIQHLFGEVHKLKGTGGTYGFFEISHCYEDLIQFLRPSFREKRSLLPQEIKKGLEKAKQIQTFLPKLTALFHCPINGNKQESSSQPLLMVIYKKREELLKTLENLSYEENIGIVTFLRDDFNHDTIQSYQPDLILVDGPLKESWNTSFSSTIRSLPSDVNPKEYSIRICSELHKIKSQNNNKAS